MRIKAAIAAIFVFLTGCTSTPDLSGWATGSAVISESVAAENSAALAKLDETLLKFQIGEKESWTTLSGLNLTEWTGHRETYAAGAVAVNAGMEAMVKYARAVANLAAAGETGKQASESLLASVDTIAKTAGQALPFGSAASTAIKDVLGVLADAVTRVQAQDKLSDTMGKMQPHVIAFGDKMKAYTGAQTAVIRKVAVVHRHDLPRHDVPKDSRCAVRPPDADFIDHWH